MWLGIREVSFVWISDSGSAAHTAEAILQSHFAVTLSAIWNLSSKGYFDRHWDCNFSLFSSCKALNQSQSWVETFLTNTFLSASRRRLLKSLSVSQRMRDEIRVSRVPDNVLLVVGMQVAALVAATTHLAHSLRARWGESESLSERAWVNSQIIIKKNNNNWALRW